MSVIISPSVLSADFGNLQRDIEMLNASKADWLHIDVMDGIFVPNISFGFPVIKAIQRVATKPLDVHLMIQEPDRYLVDFKSLGAEVLTVHFEVCKHLHRTCSAIRDLGMKVGVALNPHTPVEALSDILGEIDLVLIMSVNPGFGGQQFIPHTISKIKRLKQMIDAMGHSVLIEVDGGVNDQNARQLIQAGADVLVAGNFIFQSAQPLEAIASLK
jgi:ribulose-phosphate 3-epimerase